MSSPAFSWMWGDPVDVVERLEEHRQQEAEWRARALRQKQRRIRALVKAAKRREGKGQR